VFILAQNGTAVDTAQIVYLDMSTVLRVPVEIWPLHVTEQLAIERVQVLQESWVPAGVYEDKDESWQCRFCAVGRICKATREEHDLLAADWSNRSDAQNQGEG
jgi:hypothetical protein